jgi:hypothetical protein
MSKVENWKDIPLSEAGKQFIKELEPGVCVIVRAKHVNNIKSKLPRIQIEFAEKLNINGDNAVSAISLLNSDFSRGAQRCWVTATLAEAKALIGVEVPEDESFVEVLKPCPEYKGNKVFRLQYSEILERKPGSRDRVCGMSPSGLVTRKTDPIHEAKAVLVGAGFDRDLIRPCRKPELVEGSVTIDQNKNANTELALAA